MVALRTLHQVSIEEMEVDLEVRDAMLREQRMRENGSMLLVVQKEVCLVILRKKNDQKIMEIKKEKLKCRRSRQEGLTYRSIAGWDAMWTMQLVVYDEGWSLTLAMAENTKNHIKEYMEKAKKKRLWKNP